MSRPTAPRAAAPAPAAAPSAERNHVGPTLFWQLQRPEVGHHFTQHGQRYQIEQVEKDGGSGWLVHVKPIGGRT